ncbi:DedA family protein [Ferviditalea candida]|uniref:DedA family protein n=1 Tax=Ferviditalea candida TaxID=3108399 RepID=A0ABU5ZCF7_9BACL|nr:DedA family protein [Paenibacillaceae bacterium T2]
MTDGQISNVRLERVRLKETMLDFIAQYGYLGLFSSIAASLIGMPMPDETMMVFAGYLSSAGRLSFPVAWISSFAGSMVGMLVSYAIGRKFGRPFLERYGKWLFLSPGKLEKAEKWFQAYGIWTVSFGYYIPVVRHFTCYLSGIGRIPYPRYVLFAGTGAAVWTFTFLYLGHMLGANWRTIQDKLHSPLLLILMLAAGIAVLFALFVLGSARKRSRN